MRRRHEAGASPTPLRVHRGPPPRVESTPHPIPLPPSREREELLGAPDLERFLAIAERLVGSPDLAWDVVQEALIAMWLVPTPPPNPEAWLVRATVHRGLHARRTRARRTRHEERAAALRPELARGDPSARLIASDAHQAVARGVGELPAEYRDAFLLREVEGLEYESIAERLGVPIGTVRSRIHRARTRLAAALGSASQLLADGA